jgi:hypothetical protein
MRLEECEEGDSNQPHGARQDAVSYVADGISGTCRSFGGGDKRQGAAADGGGVTVSLGACGAGSSSSPSEEPIGAALMEALGRWRAESDRARLEEDLECALDLVRRSR